MFRRLVILMNEDKPPKIINNSVCGVAGCIRPVKEKVVFALGFSAGFCEDCAKKLKSQGLTTGTMVTPNV
jgi:hypothetical protein